jgi:hypothetical protein
VPAATPAAEPAAATAPAGSSDLVTGAALNEKISQVKQWFVVCLAINACQPAFDRQL